MTAPASATHVRAWLVIRIALIVVLVAGLAIDAYVHFDLAGNYRLIKTSTLSQADLFRAEGAVAVIAALSLLVRHRRYTAAIAALVAGSALLVLLIYRYDDIGQLAPIPSNV
jgi:O-antigen ligase